MKELVTDLFKNNADRIVERSLSNCHCIGLHSIMLLESPGQIIRLFVAMPGNHLYKNSPHFFKDGMSLGFHHHHCNITLHVVKGVLLNRTIVSPQGDAYYGSDPQPYRKYRYQSQISSGKMGFSLIEDQSLMVESAGNKLLTGQSVTMHAETIHTVYCDPTDTTAWLVYEGREDPNYEPFTYTNSRLEDQPADDQLYKKIDALTVKMLLHGVGLI